MATTTPQKHSTSATFASTLRRSQWSRCAVRSTSRLNVSSCGSACACRLHTTAGSTPLHRLVLGAQPGFVRPTSLPTSGAGLTFCCLPSIFSVRGLSFSDCLPPGLYLCGDNRAHSHYEGHAAARGPPKASQNGEALQCSCCIQRLPMAGRIISVCSVRCCEGARDGLFEVASCGVAPFCAGGKCGWLAEQDNLESRQMDCILHDSSVGIAVLDSRRLA